MDGTLAYMLSLRSLERQYNRTLREVALKHGLSPDSTQAGLVSQIENTTGGNLHSSPTWVLSGISGSGKSTIVKILQRKGFERLPNVVTRHRRPEESETDNRFVDDKTFIELQRKGELFHPHVTNGVRHAILKQDIEKLISGEHLLYLDKSVSSVLSLLEEYPALRSATFVYLLPPSFETLCERLHGRERSGYRHHALTSEQILSRLEEEIGQMKQSGNVPYAYVVNDSIERVKNIIASYL